VRDGRAERERASGVVARPNDGATVQMTIEVQQLRDNARELKGLVYSVQDVTDYRSLEAELRKASEERQSAFEEMQTLNEEMQSSNEELETTNEELQSANEELQTTNEELQSTNEELETTNEELQSTNAELDATNRELAHRTDELNRLGYGQRIIIRSLSSAVIVLDPQGRVSMWNLAAERLLGLTEAEAVGQIFWTLHVPALPRPVMARVRKSLGQNSALRNELIDYELPTGGIGRASVAAIPIVDSGTALGSVVIFDDITRAAKLAGAEVNQKRLPAKGRRAKAAK
jgi:two-component system CheB/CheR fusion protein